jgi:hypothetical protein
MKGGNNMDNGMPFHRFCLENLRLLLEANSDALRRKFVQPENSETMSRNLSVCMESMT